MKYVKHEDHRSLEEIKNDLNYWKNELKSESNWWLELRHVPLDSIENGMLDQHMEYGFVIDDEIEKLTAEYEKARKLEYYYKKKVNK